MKLARIVERLLGPHAYFYFGVRHAAALSSGFTRERALDQAMSYAHASEIDGDYLEFGVWRGRAFSAACYLARKRGLPMTFREWLEKNPQLRAVELMRFGWCGNSFVIHLTDGPKANPSGNNPAVR